MYITKKDQKIVELFRNKYPETLFINGVELTVVNKIFKEDFSVTIIAVATSTCKKGVCTGFILIWNHCSSLDDLGQYNTSFYHKYNLVDEHWTC